VLRISNNVEEKDEEEKIRTDNEIRCVRAHSVYDALSQRGFNKGGIQLSQHTTDVRRMAGSINSQRLEPIYLFIMKVVQKYT